MVGGLDHESWVKGYGSWVVAILVKYLGGRAAEVAKSRFRGHQRLDLEAGEL